MSYVYAQRRRGPAAQKSVDRNSALERTIPNSARLDALKSGTLKPSAADKGRRVDLPDTTRAKMERSFATDFSHVKLYESETVGQAGADAVAQGGEIAFAPGKADFSSRTGQALLGHELSHVASQARDGVSGGGFLWDGGLEARADREGAMAARGETVYSGASAMYGGAAAPLSSASAAPMAGPMQASKKKDKQETAPPQQRIRDNTPASPEWAAMREASESKDENAVTAAYDALAIQQSDAVTPEQFDAVNDYIVDSRSINGYLRGNEKMDAQMQAVQQQKVESIDQVMENNRLGADVNAYRAVSDVALAALLKQSGDKKLRKVVRKDGSIDHTAFAKVKDRVKGMEYTDAGFGSTSVNENYTEKWRRGIVDRDIKTREREAKFKKFHKSGNGKAMIDQALKKNNVGSFAQLDQLTQTRIKNAIGLQSDKKIEAESRKLKSNMGSHLYEIHAPKGSKAAMIDRMRKKEDGTKGNAGQQEMLIGRNARYKITDILPIINEGKIQKNQYRIIMELLEDEMENG